SSDGHTCTAVTDSFGDAEVSLTAGHTAGSYQIDVSVPTGVSAALDVTNTPAQPATLEIISGSPQSTPVNTQFREPLKVRVLDVYGNPVPDADGQQVEFFTTDSNANIPSCDGSLSPCFEPVDADGYATAPAPVADTTAGSYQLPALV